MCESSRVGTSSYYDVNNPTELFHLYKNLLTLMRILTFLYLTVHGRRSQECHQCSQRCCSVHKWFLGGSYWNSFVLPIGDSNRQRQVVGVGGGCPLSLTTVMMRGLASVSPTLKNHGDLEDNYILIQLES